MSGGEEEMKPSRGSGGQERQAMSGGLKLPARHRWRSSMRPLEPGGGSEPSPGARAAAAPLPHPESSPDLAAALPKHRHGFAGARRPRGCVDPSLAGTDNPAPATSRDAQAARDTSSPTPSASRSAPLAIRHHHPHRGRWQVWVQVVGDLWVTGSCTYAWWLTARSCPPFSGALMPFPASSDSSSRTSHVRQEGASDNDEASATCVLWHCLSPSGRHAVRQDGAMQCERSSCGAGPWSCRGGNRAAVVSGQIRRCSR
ncbi:unnamed protein product [Urochloa humidicola]